MSSTLDLTLTEDPDQQNDVFTAAFNSGDGAIFDQLYRADAISSLTGVPLTGAERTAAITAFLATNPKLSAKVVHTYRTGDTSLLVVRYRLETSGPEGEPVVLEGTCTDVMVRDEDGKWVMVIDRPVNDEPAA
ncbi:YybH family protein [Actinokineospora iranica]|uniref:Ketosteroid isomerase homolog n=1 Tax=Actinokineospora iranica TaxID=1271860 RepID=A0A1G6RY90_9PSEU|nr:nuclear transport factor 2 family protein [Actinokineospora iranica]SDD09548.1 Ketosteroid isomerase homolog [Actinokineospora iranica]